MRQWKPNSAELQQPGGARIKNPPGDVEMSDSISVEENLAAAEEVKKGNQRNEACDYREDRGLAVPASSRTLSHSRWVNSRKTWKRASISSRVRVCNRSVPNCSTANDPITPP